MKVLEVVTLLCVVRTFEHEVFVQELNGRYDITRHVASVETGAATGNGSSDTPALI